jgi:hypothetical protein
VNVQVRETGIQNADPKTQESKSEILQSSASIGAPIWALDLDSGFWISGEKTRVLPGGASGLWIWILGSGIFLPFRVRAIFVSS